MARIKRVAAHLDNTNKKTGQTGKKDKPLNGGKTQQSEKTAAKPTRPAKSESSTQNKVKNAADKIVKNGLFASIAINQAGKFASKATNAARKGADQARRARSAAQSTGKNTKQSSGGKSTAPKVVDLMITEPLGGAGAKASPTWGQVNSYKQQGAIGTYKPQQSAQHTQPKTLGEAGLMDMSGGWASVPGFGDAAATGQNAQSKPGAASKPQNASAVQDGVHPTQNAQPAQHAQPKTLGEAGLIDMSGGWTSVPGFGDTTEIRQPTQSELAEMDEGQRVAAVAAADRSERERAAQEAARELTYKANTFDPWSALRLPGKSAGGTDYIGQAAVDAPNGMPGRASDGINAGFAAPTANGGAADWNPISRIIEPMRTASRRAADVKEVERKAQTRIAEQTDFYIQGRAALEAGIQQNQATIAQAQEIIDALAPLEAKAQNTSPAPNARPSPAATPSPTAAPSTDGAAGASTGTSGGGLSAAQQKELEKARTLRRQAQYEMYLQEDRLKNLSDEARAVAIDSGIIEGELSDDERVRYNLDIKSGKTGVGQFVDQLARTTWVSFDQTVDSTKQELAAIIVNTSARISGADSVFDWREQNRNADELFDRAYSPTASMSDYSGSFDSEGWNTWQQLEAGAMKSVQQMTVDMAINGLTGGGSGAVKLAGNVARLLNSALPQMGQAALEATAAGASVEQTGNAMLLTGAMNGAIEMGGMDMIWSNAGKIAAKLRPSTLRQVTAKLNRSWAGGIVDVGAKLLSSYISEGAEEVVEDVVSGTVAKVVYDTDRAWLGEGGVVDPEQLKANWNMGGTMGTVFTVVGGLLLPESTSGNKMARKLSRYIESGGIADVDTIKQVATQVEQDMRRGEVTAADVDAHTEIWQQNGKDAPESLSAWRKKAAMVEIKAGEYKAARGELNALVDRIALGEADLYTEDGQQEYNRTMQAYETARSEYADALSENSAARDVYYTSEDELVWEIESKSVSAQERAREITDALSGADVDDRTIASPAGREAVEVLNDAIIARDGAAAELENAHREEMQADTPSGQLACKAARQEMERNLDAAKANVDAAREQLLEAVKPQTPEAKEQRIIEGRAKNKEAGVYDSRYDALTREELVSEREAQASMLAAAETARADAHGNERARLTRQVNKFSRKVAALDAEIDLRNQVYGQSDARRAAKQMESDVQSGQADAQSTSGRAEYEIEINGTLISDMTDAELSRYIKGAALSDNVVRLRLLREEQQLRTNADRRTGNGATRAKRAERLSDIMERIEEVPEWDDHEIGMQARWLQRQINALEQMEHETEGSEQKMYKRQRERAQDAAARLREEQTARRDARRRSTETLIDETEADLESEQRSIEENRIVRNQQAGLRAAEELRKSAGTGKKAMRITDTISLEDAASIFESGEGMSMSEDADDGISADTLLQNNAAKLAEWETRKSDLQDAVYDMKSHLDQLESMAKDVEAGSVEEGRLATELLNTKDAIDKAEALIKRADSEIRYYESHSAQSVVESLASGHIAEPLMERIMGMVNTMRDSSQMVRHLNTPDRVFDDAFGVYSPIMRAVFIDPVKHAETGRTKYKQSVIEDVKKLRLNSAESELVQRYGEGLMTPAQLLEAIDDKLAKRGQKLKRGDGTWESDADAKTDIADASGAGSKSDEVRRIAYAARVIGKHYADMYTMVNDALVRNGYEPLGKIPNYFPHFDGEEGGVLRKALKKLGFSAQNLELPADIYGLTETFTPSRQSSPFTRHRTGSRTTFDALEGLSRYLDPMTSIAYHTDNIKRLRQLESAIRNGEKDGTLEVRPRSGGDYGKMAVWVHEYANQLAGKKANIFGDRDLEKMIGRKVYSAISKLTNARGAAAVALNVGSALSNTLVVVEVAVKHPVAMVQAMGRWGMQLISDGDAVPESEFLVRRFGTDQLQDTIIDKLTNAVSKPFELVDVFAGNIVVRTCYEANLRAGMDAESAMRSADAEAARLMADRSKGAMPNLFGSKLFMATLGQFQIEPLNQFMRLAKDTWRELASDPKQVETGRGGEVKTKLGADAMAKGTGMLALTSIVSWLTNMAWKALTGRDILPDPIGAVQEGIQNYEENGDWYEAASTSFSAMLEQMPFFGMGRLGTNITGDMNKHIGELWDALIGTFSGEGDVAQSWNKVFWNGMAYITGGGQIKKTYQGMGKLLQDGAFLNDGRLMYPVDASDGWTRVQAQMFGYSSTKYARMYYDEGREPLTDENTQKYLDMVEAGMNPGEAYESLYALQKADKLADKLKDAVKAGDTQGAERIQGQIDALTAQVDFAAVIPAVAMDEVGKPYMDMLETAWRESGDSNFLPEYYWGEFTKDKEKMKFMPEAVEKLQPVYERYVAHGMEKLSGKWANMTAAERKEAYSKCKTEARAAAKKYGLENKLPYISKDEYEAAGYIAPEKAGGAQMQPGLTNPVQDAIRVATGEPVGTVEGGFAEDAAKVLSGSGVTPAEPKNPDELMQTASEIDAQTGGQDIDLPSDSDGSGGKHKGGRGGRKSGGGSGSHGAASEAATYWQRRARAALGDAFGGIDDGGAALGLSGSALTLYQKLFNAYMTLYMWQGERDWDAADSAGKTRMLESMAGKARTAAEDFYGRFYA